jgi:hypothetical protein
MASCRLFASFLLLFMWIFPMTAQDSLLYRRMTIPDTLCTVEAALRAIEHHTGLSFSYNTGLFNKKKFITFGADQERLIDLLSQVFNDATLNFSIIGRHLVVYRSLKTRAVNPESKVDSVYYFEIRGRVLDKENQQPLPFSSIYLMGKSIGTISNDDGGFLLKLSSAYISETLTISCVGYKNFTAPVSSLINTENSYYLKTDVISIQEVIIRKLSPVLLLQSAIENIRNNYPQEPAILTSFYRETIKRNNHYMMVSEALLENYKAGYATMASDQVKILKGRKSVDFNRNDSVMLKLKAGLNTMLMLDVVKNMPDFLNGESLQDYNYKLADIVIEDGKDNYAIEFTPKESSSSAIYSGRIILDIRDLAFRWIEFYVSPEQLGQATNLYIVRKPPHLIVKMLKASYKVAFRQSGSKYYLHMVQSEAEFRIRSRRQLSGSDYYTKLEMAVTDIDTIDVGRFPLKETARLHEFFTDQIGAYDESFWGEYNFITPDESLENAIVKLNKTQEARKEEERDKGQGTGDK